jgi:hypothetical protein
MGKPHVSPQDPCVKASMRFCAFLPFPSQECSNSTVDDETIVPRSVNQFCARHAAGATEETFMPEEILP